MMQQMLTPRQWSKIYAFLKEQPNLHAKSEDKCRKFIEAVVWMARSGAQWRLLPSEYGNWNTVYYRASRWGDKGIWQRMFCHFADDVDMEHLIIDSTIIRAHPSAAGAAHKKGGKSRRR